MGGGDNPTILSTEKGLLSMDDLPASRIRCRKSNNPSMKPLVSSFINSLRPLPKLDVIF
jgi:hypothetical protein